MASTSIILVPSCKCLGAQNWQQVRNIQQATFLELFLSLQMLADNGWRTTAARPDTGSVCIVMASTSLFPTTLPSCSSLCGMSVFTQCLGALHTHLLIPLKHYFTLLINMSRFVFAENTQRVFIALFFTFQELFQQAKCKMCNPKILSMVSLIVSSESCKLPLNEKIQHICHLMWHSKAS